MPGQRYRVTVGERVFEVEAIDQEGELLVRVGGRQVRVDLLRQRGQALLSALLDGESVQALVDLRGEVGTVVLRGVPFEVRVEDERAARLAALVGASQRRHAAATLVAPMPGLVVRVNVAPGAAVERGEPLVVLQAMKMENELAAPRAGTVKMVAVQAGQTVEHGQTLVVLE